MGKVTAWDDAEAAVTLQPHPDARVHPLKAELDALRARLAAEAAEELEEERGSGKAPSGQGGAPARAVIPVYLLLLRGCSCIRTHV